jgi:hypothetical protein
VGSALFFRIEQIRQPGDVGGHTPGLVFRQVQAAASRLVVEVDQRHHQLDVRTMKVLAVSSTMEGRSSLRWSVIVLSPARSARSRRPPHFDAACAVGERLRSAIADNTFEIGIPPPIKITISIGVSEFGRYPRFVFGCSRSEALSREACRS